MTLKHMFLSTAAASSLLLAVAAVEPSVFSWATKAQAATNISVNINFYDDLAPYGNWVSYHDRYVWIPEDVDARWRPYTEGHWAYTRRYGWIWVSDERFGWATYHYGRWGYARDIGWYWVPGRRWAPAWVAWRYDDHHIAWAPLPPDPYDDANTVISFGDIPDYYWQAVPVSAFLSVDLSGHVYRDRDGARHGEPRTVRILNNVVLNNVIKVDDIEKKTKKKVVVLEVKAVDNPDAAGKADSTSVAIFNPEVKEETNAKPKKTRKIEEVVKEREAKGIPDEEQPPGRVATTADEAAPVVEPVKPVEKAKIIPSFDTVQVEPTGEALIAGRAEPGSEVMVKLNGMTVGTAVANADGAFVITPDKPLPPGPGTLSIESKSNEVVVASADSVAVDVKAVAGDARLVGVPKPALPPSKTVNLDTVAYDQSGNIVFGGRGPVGSEVQLYVDNNPYGLAAIDDKGTWTFAGLFPLTVGTHTLRAQEIGRDGAVKSRIEMPFYREDPGRVAAAPLAPATPEAPKPAEVATAQDVPAPTPPVEEKKKQKDTAAPEQAAPEKNAQAPAEEQTASIENTKKEATVSIDQPDIEKTVEAPAAEQAVPVVEKKEATASTDQPDIEMTVVVPAGEQTASIEEMEKQKDAATPDLQAVEKSAQAPAKVQTVPVEVKKKKKVAAAPDQQAVEKSAQAPAKVQTVPVEVKKKKKVAAAPDRQAVDKSAQVPAEVQTASIESKKKKKAEEPANTKRKGKPECDPAVANCPPAQTLSKPKPQSTKRVMPKANLRDAGAESWKINCSPMFGSFTKASETYLSSAGKRVSCAMRPKNARG